MVHGEQTAVNEKRLPYPANRLPFSAFFVCPAIVMREFHYLRWSEGVMIHTNSCNQFAMRS